MSKTKNVTTDAEVTPDVEFITEGVACYLVKTDDGVAIKDLDGNLTPAEVTKDGLCYKLPKNAANRQWYMIAKFEKDIETHPDGIPLTYKPSRTLGSVGTKIPNEKLIAYLSEEDQAEYRAIIDRAIAAKNADVAKPKSEADKLRDRIEAAKKKLAALEALTANGDVQ